jgi:hypothetical protein
MHQDDKDLEWLFKNYQNFFEKFGMNKNNITSVYYEWKEGPSDTVMEYLCAIFEKLLYETYEQVADPKAKFKILSFIFGEMRDYKINFAGAKANDIYKKYLFCQLKLLQLSSTPFVVKVIAVRCCPYCDVLHGTELTIEEALEKQLLPSEKCTNDVGCHCFYKPENVRGDTGKLYNDSNLL